MLAIWACSLASFRSAFSRLWDFSCFRLNLCERRSTFAKSVVCALGLGAIFPVDGVNAKIYPYRTLVFSMDGKKIACIYGDADELAIRHAGDCGLT